MWLTWDPWGSFRGGGRTAASMEHWARMRIFSYFDLFIRFVYSGDTRLARFLSNHSLAQIKSLKGLDFLITKKERKKKTASLPVSSIMIRRGCHDTILYLAHFFLVGLRIQIMVAFCGKQSARHSWARRHVYIIGGGGVPLPHGRDYGQKRIDCRRRRAKQNFNSM